MKRKKGVLIYPILAAVLFAGIALLLYPTLSDYWNSRHQTKAIISYMEAVSALSDADYERLLEEAEAYNGRLSGRQNAYGLSEEEEAEYERLLDVGGDGAMGYIEIPSISCSLPIYHGTDEAVLQTSVGHLEWTSLPVGGPGTHTVLSGHRGLPSAKLFTDLDRLAAGDVFVLNVLNRVLTYEVDRILIVDPSNVGPLAIRSGADECTLVTCTPYGINTHRLLVRGHRIENTKAAEMARITAEAVQVEPLIVAPLLAIPLLAVSFLLMAESDRARRRDLF